MAAAEAAMRFLFVGGVGHPDALMTINNPAQLLELQGRLDKAEPLRKKTVHKHATRA